MKREDIVLVYKTLVQMKDFAAKLDEALKKEEFEKASQIKNKILELQRGLSKIL